MNSSERIISFPVNPGSKEFVQALSRKSGVSLIQAESLFNAIHQVSEQSEVSDFELLSLNEQIQQFYKTGNDGRTSL